MAINNYFHTLAPEHWLTEIKQNSTIEKFEDQCGWTESYGIEVKSEHYAKALNDAEKCGNNVRKEHIFNKIFPLTRGSDKLTLVKVEDITKVTPSDISRMVGNPKDFPVYKADGLNVTLIFHTATKEVVLANFRENPCLKEQKTKDGKEFPVQLNSTTGGYLPNPELSLKEAALNNVKYKLLIDTPIENEECKALEVLSKAIQTNEGWEKQVCIHTNKWEEQSTEKTMCVITAVKHLSCKDIDLDKINEALRKMVEIKKAQNIDARRLSQFEFVELAPIIHSPRETYSDTEVDKANKAYPFKDKTALVFNDLSVAAMSFGGSFQGKEFAQFST